MFYAQTLLWKHWRVVLKRNLQSIWNALDGRVFQILRGLLSVHIVLSKWVSVDDWVKSSILSNGFGHTLVPLMVRQFGKLLLVVCRYETIPECHVHSFRILMIVLLTAKGARRDAPLILVLFMILFLRTHVSACGCFLNLTFLNISYILIFLFDLLWARLLERLRHRLVFLASRLILPAFLRLLSALVRTAALRWDFCTTIDSLINVSASEWKRKPHVLVALPIFLISRGRIFWTTSGVSTMPKLGRLHLFDERNTVIVAIFLAHRVYWAVVGSTQPLILLLYQLFLKLILPANFHTILILFTFVTVHVDLGTNQIIIDEFNLFIWGRDTLLISCCFYADHLFTAFDYKYLRFPMLTTVKIPWFIKIVRKELIKGIVGHKSVVAHANLHIRNINTADAGSIDSQGPNTVLF